VTVKQSQWHKKVHFLRKKCIRLTWLEDVLTLKWPGSFAALAPPLHVTPQQHKRKYEANKFQFTIALYW